MRMLVSCSLLVCFFLGTGSADAHDGNNDPNVVHACVSRVSKVARIVGVAGTCVSAPAFLAEVPMHWSISGPGGPQGPQGQPGSSVTFVGYFSGNQEGCPNGGAVYSTGTPPTYSYVCNGAATALSSLEALSGVPCTLPDGSVADIRTTTARSGAVYVTCGRSQRYVDNGDGTVTDTQTNLIWLQRANCLGNGTYQSAVDSVSFLESGFCGLTDGSQPGDWRIATIDEWIATVQDAVRYRCRNPAVTNAIGSGCGLAGVTLPFVMTTTGGGFPFYYARIRDDGRIYVVESANGAIDWFGDPGSNVYVWPVRSRTP